MKAFKIVPALVMLTVISCWSFAIRQEEKREADQCEWRCWKKYHYCAAKPHEPGSCSQTYDECMADNQCERTS